MSDGDGGYDGGYDLAMKMVEDVMKVCLAFVQQPNLLMRKR